MSDFVERSAELVARFDIMRPSLTPADAALVDAALKRHGELRSGRLSLLCEIAEDTGTDKKAEVFASQLNQAATDVLAVLNGLLDGINEPSANLRAFCGIAKDEESTFFDGLKKLNCGATRDEMLRHKTELQAHTEALRARWTKMSADEKTLLDRERLSAGQMREVMRKAHEEAVPAYYTVFRNGSTYANYAPKKIGEAYDWLKQKVKDAQEKSGGDPANAEKIMDAVAELAKQAVVDLLDGLDKELEAGKLIEYGAKGTKYAELLTQGEVDRQVKEIKDSLKCGRRVIVTFSGTRREAADFVRKNGYSVAKPYCEAARNELASFVSAQPSSSEALRNEAQRFADRAQRSWQHFLEEMRGQHESFVNEFDGIFVEQVSETTINQLTDLPELKALADEVNNMDLDQKLNAVYDNLVDLHGDLDNAFGSLTVFTELPLKSQATIQQAVKAFGEQRWQPFTSKMAEQLRKLDDARGKKTKTIVDEILSDAQEMAVEAAREAGAPKN